jgi:hypothetical protein
LLLGKVFAATASTVRVVIVAMLIAAVVLLLI